MKARVLLADSTYLMHSAAADVSGNRPCMLLSALSADMGRFPVAVGLLKRESKDFVKGLLDFISSHGCDESRRLGGPDALGIVLIMIDDFLAGVFLARASVYVRVCLVCVLD